LIVRLNVYVCSQKLDIQVSNGEALLKKYDLKANDAILADEKHMYVSSPGLMRISVKDRVAELLSSSPYLPGRCTFSFLDLELQSEKFDGLTRSSFFDPLSNASSLLALATTRSLSRALPPSTSLVEPHRMLLEVLL
jgi:hypothetical protein